MKEFKLYEGLMSEILLNNWIDLFTAINVLRDLNSFKLECGEKKMQKFFEYFSSPKEPQFIDFLLIF